MMLIKSNWADFYRFDLQPYLQNEIVSRDEFINWIVTFDFPLHNL